MITLLADSGSTKTAWSLLVDRTPVLRFTSSGLNPCLMSEADISHILLDEVVPQLPLSTLPHSDGTPAIDQIRFYGAGCRPDKIAAMQRLLCRHLSAAAAIVASDLLGAAHALFGREAGIVGILGTGSGSAVYDGTTFTSQTPSLGFILGDEGSGAVLGRRLIAGIFKRQFPTRIIDAFHAEYATTVEEVIQHVYREAAPNRYLAQFTHFLSRHIDDPAVEDFAVNEFRDFFVRNLRIYDRPDLPVGIVGSVAHIFKAQLLQAASETGFRVHRIIQSPIESLETMFANGIL